MKKIVISLLLATAIICSISVNVFACEDTCPHIMVREPEVTITK